MATGGWIPAAEPLAHLQREINRLFDAVFGKHFFTPGRLRAGYVYPPTNVRETADQYVVACELPGLTMDDLEVYATGDEVTISGRRPDAIPEEGVTLHRRERDAGRFGRALTLPGPVDSSRTEASLRNGILVIRIPKAEETRAKPIQVRVES